MDQQKFNTVKDVDTSKIEELSAKLRGKIVMPSNDNYNETRKVYNAMIDKHPGMFVMCVDVADDYSGGTISGAFTQQAILCNNMVLCRRHE